MSRPAVGLQEVVYGNATSWPKALETPGALRDMIILLMRRVAAAAGRWRYVQAFVNGGPGGSVSGASLGHPHAQVVALPFVPPLPANRLRRAAAHWHASGQCVCCELVTAELAAGERVVRQHQGWIALAREAPRFPYELLLLPVAHRSRLEEAPERDWVALADLLQDVLRALYGGLGGEPPFNVVFHSAPRQERRAGFHAHVEVLPRLAHAGGLELGSGVFINTVTPESAAELLRAHG